MSEGYLRPIDWAVFDDWTQRAAIPFFGSPTGFLTAWIERGWITPLRQPSRPVNSQVGGVYVAGDGESNTPSLVVRERRADGWLSVVLAPMEQRPQWTHECLLSLGAEPLGFHSWEEHLTTMMYFIDPGTYPLRASASDDAAVIGTVPGGWPDADMHKLETSGDWMRVRVLMPSDWCDIPAPPAGRTQAEGWIRWRDQERGMLISRAAAVC